MTAPSRLDAIPYDAPLGEHELVTQYGLDATALIKLDANENPYGAPPSAKSALAQVLVNRYPDAGSVALRTALGTYTGCRPEQILLGNGSDELIELICRVLLRPGDRVVICPPTFSLYALAARTAGAEIVEAHRNSQLTTDHQALVTLIDANTKIVFLCSPNNPTGDSLSEAQLRSILHRGALVVLDEAYAEFSGVSYMALISEYENLIILRTFSKAFGLAGLRIGYGVFPERLVAPISTAKLPYNVNAAAQMVALAALGDRTWVEQHAALIRKERDRLFKEVRDIQGLVPLSSDANFVLVRVTGMHADRLQMALARMGIVIRNFRQPDLANYVRITVGTPDQNTTLLGALRLIMAEGKR